MSARPVVGQAVLALEAPAPGPSPEEIHAAALVLARSLHRHLLAAIAVGRLESAMGALRGFESLVSLIGVPLAASVFAAACEPERQPNT